MELNPSFRDMLRRVRAGDPAAAAELVRQFEPKVRRAAGGRLDDLRLRAALDSGDISQTVFANFFPRVEDGQFVLETPDHLLGLLLTMARNSVRDAARKVRAEVRGGGRRAVADPEHCLSGLPAAGPTPSRLVSDRELADQTYHRLAADERYLLEQRVAGREWAELAAELNSTPGALRKKLARAVQRVAAELFE